MRLHPSLVAVLGLAGLSLGASALVSCRGWESTEPPVHLNPNMDTQEKGKSYRADSTGLFADGRMMRPPVAGTVAIEEPEVIDPVLDEGLVPDGGTDPSLAFPAGIGCVDPLVQLRGKERYGIYCAPCHGAVGDGKGPVAGKGLLVPPPAMTDPRLKGLPVGKLYAAIKHGVNNGNMPSYAAQIPVPDRWAIVSFVRVLQQVPCESGEVITVAAATSASVQHGEQLYKARGCNACHSLDGTKLVGPSFKGVAGRLEETNVGQVSVNADYLKESILQPMAKIVNGYPPVMPPIVTDPLEADSLVLFIQAQK